MIAVLAAGTVEAADSSEPVPPGFDTCLACHGEDGRSETPGVPSLGGQPMHFAMMQLFLFRERRRDAPPMGDIAAPMTDSDLRAFSQAIAALPPPEPASGADPRRYARGAALADRHLCGSCHRPDYSGQAQMPRLAGQREAYLLKALRDYKSGARIGSTAAMAEVLHGITDDQLADLAHYLAHFRAETVSGG